MKRVTGISSKLWTILLCLGLLSGCALQTGETDPVKETKGGATQAQTAGGRTTTPAKSGTAAPATIPGLTGTAPAAFFPVGARVARRALGTLNSLNPHRMSLSSEEDMAKYLFGSLYLAAGNKNTGELEFLPYHALALPLSQDPVRYTISLRPGLTWSDGSAIKAGDYVNSLRLLLDPKLNNPTAVRFVQDLGILNAGAYKAGTQADFAQVGFRALDDQTLELVLESPMDALDVYSLLTTPFLVHPQRYESQLSGGREATAYGSDYKQLLYSGPYELEDFQPGQSVRLKKRLGTALDAVNDVYYTADYISQQAVNDKTTALEEFYRGELDVVSISGRAYRELKDDKRVRVVGSNTVWGLYVNTQAPGILQNADFRKALYYGVDRTAIAVTMFGSYNSYSGFIGPQALVSGPQGPVNYRKTSRGKSSVDAANVYDLTKARKFAQTALAEVTSPQTIEITVPADDVQMLEMAQFLKSSWEELFKPNSITFTIRTLPLTAAYESYRAGDYDLGFGGMGQELFNPWRSLAVFTSDYPGKLDTMADARFDELYQAAAKGALRSDAAGRLDALKEMEDILLERLPQIPLFTNSNAYLVSDRLSLPFKEAVPGYGLGLDMAGYK